MRISASRGIVRAGRVALVVLSLGFAALPAASQEPWEKAPFEAPAQELLKAAQSVPAEEGTSLVVLLRETRWTYQADGRAETRTHLVYHVRTPEGVEVVSAVRDDWSPWYQDRPTIRARVTTLEGKTQTLNPATLGERPVAGNDPEVFTDRRSLTGPLPSVAVGCVVELETVIAQTRPFFDRGTTQYHYFGSAHPLQRERLVLDAPDSLPLAVVVRKAPDAKRREETSGARKIVTFELGAQPAAKPVESLTAGDVPLQPYVAFTTGGSWGAVARRYHEIVEAQIASADLGALGELPSKELAPEKRLSEILARIQAKVRYTSLAFGEASIIPRPPGECLKRGYGDCKDKSALLVAALRRVGLGAHVALLNTGPGPDVEAELPGLGGFDHAIVHLDAPDLWVDPTDKYAKPGALPLGDAGRRALIAAPETLSLTLIPEAKPEEHVEIKEREVFLSEYGAGRVVETLRGHGEPERRHREAVDQDRKIVTKNFESYASQVFLSKKLAACTYGSATDLSQSMEIRLEAVEAGRAQTDLREAIVGISLDTLWNGLPFFLRDLQSAPKAAKDAPPWRTNDIVLFQPYVQELRYRIVPPPGFKARPVPRNEQIPFGPALFTKEYSLQEDGTVRAVFRFDCVKSRYTPAEGKALRAAIQKNRGDGMTSLKFVQVGTSHLEAGRIKEALAEYRALAKAAPTKALYRSQIALALLAGGLGDAAREEAKKAAELQPDFRVPHEVLGWVLQHDLLGRRFEKGWDPKGAEAAYRRAIELQSDVLEIHLNLAIMLEVDADGVRYGSPSRLEEAIKEYQSVAKEIDGTAYDKNLSIALMWAGRFGELLERTNAPTPVNRVLGLVARAAQDGPEAALTSAAQNIPEDEARQASLSEAGDLLVKLRHYREASALLAAAARGSSDAASLLGRAERFGRAARWEDLPREAKDPANVVKRALGLIMAPELDLPAAKALFSRYALGGEASDRVDAALQAMHTGIISGLRRQALSVPVLRDLTLSLAEPAVEGDGENGYRVRIPAVFGNGGSELWYLHPEDGALKLLGPGVPDVGRLVLDALKSGREAKARIWLDWAADELPPLGAGDPLEADPFSVWWKKGKDADLATMRRAAALLAVREPHCADAVKILEEARQEEGLDQKRAFILDRALATGYLSDERGEEASSATLRMLAAEPESELAYFMRRRTLDLQHRYDDLVQLIERELKRKPDDVALLHDLQHGEMQRGRMEASLAVGRKIVKLGQADAWVYNNLAWAALIAGKPTEATLKDAQQSVMASRSKSDACLHTMAAVYADLGRPAEARDVLLQAIRLRGDPEPQSQDWYVLGRIAEEYGALDAARAAYKRTKDDRNIASASSTNNLSLRRLKLLSRD